jgi:hypothetical protein
MTRGSKKERVSSWLGFWINETLDDVISQTSNAPPKSNHRVESSVLDIDDGFTVGVHHRSFNDRHGSECGLALVA